jgi:hypothetical protein
MTKIPLLSSLPSLCRAHLPPLLLLPLLQGITDAKPNCLCADWIEELHLRLQHQLIDKSENSHQPTVSSGFCWDTDQMHNIVLG